jgi:hypothetical protein
MLIVVTKQDMCMKSPEWLHRLITIVLSCTQTKNEKIQNMPAVEKSVIPSSLMHRRITPSNFCDPRVRAEILRGLAYNNSKKPLVRLHAGVLRPYERP